MLNKQSVFKLTTCLSLIFSTLTFSQQALSAEKSLDSLLSYCHETTDSDLSAKKCLFKELAAKRYESGESISIARKQSSINYASLSTTDIVVGCGKVEREECAFKALGYSLMQLGQSTELELNNVSKL